MLSSPMIFGLLGSPSPNMAKRSPRYSMIPTKRKISGERLGPAAGTAMAGWHEHAPRHPKVWSEVADFTADAGARLKKMDEYGIWAQVLYPNVAGSGAGRRAEEHTSELQSLMRNSYAVFCLKKKNI